MFKDELKLELRAINILRKVIILPLPFRLIRHKLCIKIVPHTPFIPTRVMLYYILSIIDMYIHMYM